MDQFNSSEPQAPARQFQDKNPANNVSLPGLQRYNQGLLQSLGIQFIPKRIRDFGNLDQVEVGNAAPSAYRDVTDRSGPAYDQAINEQPMCLEGALDLPGTDQANVNARQFIQHMDAVETTTDQAAALKTAIAFGVGPDGNADAFFSESGIASSIQAAQLKASNDIIASKMTVVQQYKDQLTADDAAALKG